MSGRYGAHRWTAEEDSFLIENYPLLGGPKTIEKLNEVFNTNFTWDNARHHYKLLKVRQSGEQKLKKVPWSEEEVRFVIDNYCSLGIEKTAIAVSELYKNNRTKYAVDRMVKRLRAEGYNCFIGKGSKNKWSEEEESFLIKYYPNHGIEETVKKFNEIFQTNRTKNSIRNRAINHLHLNITSEVKRSILKKAQQKCARSIGDIVPWKMSNGKTELYIKTSDDQWVMLKHYLVGEEASGKFVIFLNGDRTDFREENLAVVTKGINTKMSIGGFYSKNPDITKAGIAICELEELLKKQNINTNEEDED